MKHPVRGIIRHCTCFLTFLLTWSHMKRPGNSGQLQSSVVMGLKGLTSVQFTSLMLFVFSFFLSLNAKCMVSWNSHHFHTGWSSKHTRHDLGVSTCVACPACGCVSDQAQLQWQNPCQHQTTLVDCEQVNYNQPNASCFFMRCFGRFQEKV